MGLSSKPSPREVQKYIDNLNNESARLYDEALAFEQHGAAPDASLAIQKSTLLQGQAMNILLGQLIQNTAMTVDQLSILVKRRDK